MGKSSISMAIFNSKLFVYQRVWMMCPLKPPFQIINGNFRILKWRYVNVPYFRPYFLGMFPETQAWNIGLFSMVGAIEIKDFPRFQNGPSIPMLPLRLPKRRLHSRCNAAGRAPHLRPSPTKRGPPCSLDRRPGDPSGNLFWKWWENHGRLLGWAAQPRFEIWNTRFWSCY